MSKGEERIKQILDKAKISYVREFPLHGLRNGFYRLDFYIPGDKVGIEFEGEQHYQFVSKFFKSRSEFLKAQERSRRKMAYCLANNIKLYCIPYWEYDNLHTVRDLFQEKFRVTSKFHDDVVWSEYQEQKKFEKNQNL